MASVRTSGGGLTDVCTLKFPALWWLLAVGTGSTSETLCGGWKQKQTRA